MNITAIRSAAQKMLIDFEATRSIRHNPTKGRAREYAVVEQFLRPYLPARYAVGSGLIVDLHGTESRQQDLMIYDGLNAPVLLDLDADKILFPESVFAAVEVKSTLSRRELADMAAKSASVTGMTTALPPVLTLAPGLSIPSVRVPPLCMGFAFESTLALADVPGHLREVRGEVPNAHALALVCVLKDRNGAAGLVVSVEEADLGRVTTAPSPSSRIAHVPTESAGDALLYCYLILMSHLAACGAVASGPDLFAYARGAGFGVPGHAVAPGEAAGGSAVVDGQTIRMDRVQELVALAREFARGALDDEGVLDLFRGLTDTPFAGLMRDERARFATDDGPLAISGPAAMLRALNRRAEGAAGTGDSEVLAELLRLMRGAYGGAITVVVPGTSHAFGLCVPDAA